MEFPTWISRVIVIFLGCAALYFAAHTVLNPGYYLHPLERNIAARIGNIGLAIVWVLSATGCFWGAYKMESDSEKKDN